MVKLLLDPALTVAIIASLAMLASVVSWVLLGRSWKALSKAMALSLCWLIFTAAIIQSGASADLWTIGATSKAGYVELRDSSGRETSLQSKDTCAASGTFTPAATPTDLVIIEGSATKTIRVISMRVVTTNTAAGSQQFFLIKRSTADTTGTFVAATQVSMDSANPACTSNRVGHFTANPGALGTVVGTINTIRLASPVAIPATWAGITDTAERDMMATAHNSILDEIVTLRGVAQTLAINFNGVALVAGQTHAYTVVWTEE